MSSLKSSISLLAAEGGVLVTTSGRSGGSDDREASVDPVADARSGARLRRCPPLDKQTDARRMPAGPAPEVAVAGSPRRQTRVMAARSGAGRGKTATLGRRDGIA